MSRRSRLRASRAKASPSLRGRLGQMGGCWVILVIFSVVLVLVSAFVASRSQMRATAVQLIKQAFETLREPGTTAQPVEQASETPRDVRACLLSSLSII